MLPKTLTVISMVKIYSADDDINYLSLAGVTGVNDTREYILVFPVFAEQPMTFKYNETHARYEHSNSEGEVLFIHYVARISKVDQPLHLNNTIQSEHSDELFATPGLLPKVVRDVVNKYMNHDDIGLYKTCEEFLSELEPLGYTFDYGLDGMAYDLRLINDEASR